MNRAWVPLALVSVTILGFGQELTPAGNPAPKDFIPPRVVQPLVENQRVVLKGNTHPLARPQFDVGGAPPDLAMQRMLLILKRSPEQQSALNQLLDAQQDASSASYHKWVTPEDFGRRFGPSDTDMQVVTSWLQGHGFQIGKLAKGRNVIEFSGTAAQVEETFSSPIHKYAMQGQEHWANATDPQIPAALAPVVGGIASLHSFGRKPQIKPSPERFTVSYKGTKPEFTGSNGSHALAPGDFAVIYNVNPQYRANPRVDGTGTSIAVVGRTNIDVGNIFNFRSLFGLPITLPQVVVNGPDPGDLCGGEEFEAYLDATWSGAVAPGATIFFVVSATTNTTDGVVLSEEYIVDNNLADVMTESFGLCETFAGSEVVATNLIAEQAAAQGITFVASAGDSGAAGCDDPSSTAEQFGLSVNIPASTPFTVAVGGTEFNEGSNPSKYWSSNTTVPVTALAYIPENVWNESCTPAQCGRNAGLWATGGGSSASFAKPAWQNGFGDSRRDIPDVSLTAATHDPYLICALSSCSQGFLYAVGGTSASAPSFAGIMALVVQKMGGRQGLANYVLYQLARHETFSSCNGSAGTLVSSCVFNDVTKGNNGVPGEVGYPSSSLYGSRVGYDMATGLGSVNVNNLVRSWAAEATTLHATSTTLTLSPTTGAHGQQVNVTINVSSSSGTPAGNVSLITDLVLPDHTSPPVDLCSSVGGCTLDGTGSLTTSTGLLPGGTYNVHAHYPGNASFKASDSTPVSVTIGTEPSTINLIVAGSFDSFQNPVALPSTIPYGTFVYLRADVAGTSGIGIPTSYVTFMDNSFTPISNSLLNSEGTASTPSGYFNSSGPSHSVTAFYGGDNSFQSVTSTPFSFSVTKANTSLAMSYTGETHGANLNAAVVTNSGGYPPSGTVSFLVDGNAVGSPVFVNGQPAVINPFLAVLFGAAPAVRTGARSLGTWLDSGLPNGRHTLVATYSGDGNYASATSAPFAFNLQPDFILSASNDVIGISLGSSTTMALFIDQLDGFSGTVSFSCSGLPAESTCSFSPASIKGSGNSILTISTTAPKADLNDSSRPLQLWFASGAGLASICLLGVPMKRRRMRNIVGMFAFAIVLGSLGCGGGGSSSSPVVTHDPGTKTGIYTVTVNASSGSLRHAVSFSLVIR
jgi:Pro-kumamolisin, activation domain/Bacterial Ig-like domain (group 3)